MDPSTNYEQQADSSYLQGRVYTRADNPTYEHAERLLAAPEGAGCACALFASGMAAATSLFQSLLPGDLTRPSPPQRRSSSARRC
ncbi:MAG: PLP-dependent transferase [Vicinamibacteria bacterium]